MRILINQDLVFTQKTKLSQTQEAELRKALEEWNRCSVFYSLDLSQDQVMLKVQAQKICLEENDMAYVHELFDVFWDTELKLFDYSGSGYSFYLTAVNQNNVLFEDSVRV